MKTGTYAGLFTGLLSIVIGMSALFVITFVFMDIIRQNAFTLYDFHRSGLKSIDQFIIEDVMGAALIGTLFSLLAGVIFGTIGGYLGRTKITYESSVPNQTGHPKSCIINRARTALGVSNPPQWPKKTEQSHHGARKDFAEFFVSPKRLAHTCAKSSVSQSSPCC